MYFYYWESVRESEARFVRPCTTGQNRVLKDTSRGWGVEGRESYKVKEGVKPDNCQGNKLLLGLMVGEPTLHGEVGSGEGANSCYPHLKFPGLKLLSL